MVGLAFKCDSVNARVCLGGNMFDSDMHRNIFRKCEIAPHTNSVDYPEIALTIEAFVPLITRTFFFIIYEKEDDFASHSHSDVKRKIGSHVVA